MPLVKFTFLKGKTEKEIKKLLDISHEVFVETLGIPITDRFQIVNQLEPYELIMEDTGLNFSRTDKRILISIISRPRPKEKKVNLYTRLADEYHKQLGINPKDIMINFVINDDEDWSFGFGRAQFLTRELS